MISVVTVLAKNSCFILGRNKLYWQTIVDSQMQDLL